MLPQSLAEYANWQTLALALFFLVILLFTWVAVLRDRLNYRAEMQRPAADPLDDRIAARLAEKDLPADDRLDARLRDLLLDRVTHIFAHPEDHDYWLGKIDEKLCHRAGARAGEAAPQLDQRIDVALRGRLETIFDHPDSFEDWFTAVDDKLGAAVHQRIAALTSSGAEDSLGGLVREQLVGRVEAMFENPDDNEYLFESIDEALHARITHVAANLPGEAAGRVDGVIHEALVGQVGYIFENAERYEHVFETIDEKLGERIVRQAEHPPHELKERLDEPLRAGLAARVEALFDNPDEYEDVFEQVHDQLSRRVERRLREELARGADGLIEQLIAEALRRRVEQQLDDRGRRDALNLAIDSRIKGRNGNEV